MQRLRLYDVRLSRLPQQVGICVGDTNGLCSIVNAAQQRLMFCPESGDEGWYGTWAEVGFDVSRTSPYLTLPREIARLENVVLCDTPIPVYNQFYEYLMFGSGRLPKQFRQNNPNCLQLALSRNNCPTFVDLSTTPQYLRAYATSEADITTRIFWQGLDENSKTIRSMDGANVVEGVFYGLEIPFVTSTEKFTRITGIQKDQTVGPVEVWQVDPDTGDEVLLLVMQPSETTASYRRYYFSNLPNNCCGTSSDPTALQLRAICKLEPLPVQTDTDYLVIQNLQALTQEAMAVRYSEMDTDDAKKMEINAHRQAVRYLNGELAHYYGITKPSVSVKPYGSADLRKQAIGTMI